jgi:opacity protein-like surface antigen
VIGGSQVVLWAKPDRSQPVFAESEAELSVAAVTLFAGGVIGVGVGKATHRGNHYGLPARRGKRRAMARLFTWPGGALTISVVMLSVVSAAAQQPSSTATPRPAQETTPGGAILPGPPLPSVLLPPRWGPDLLSPQAVQGPLTLTPSIAITEEYNDNIFATNRNKRSDFITQFTPGIMLSAQQPGFNLTAGYTLGAEIYARNEELSNAANRHNFLASVSYDATPRLRLGLTDGFAYDKNSNAASLEGISTGRRESWSNVFSPALDYQVTQRLTWRLLGAYEIQRFSGPTSRDSDVYRIGSGLDFVVTPRLSLTGGYDFAYFDIQQEPKAMTHTPRLGASYQFTPTLVGAGSGGPSFRVEDGGDTTISPSVSASLTKAMSWGSMQVLYDRAIRTSGGAGGTADTQTITGSIAVSTLVRGLVASFSPRYTISKDEGGTQSSGDIEALTLNLSLRYQIARYVSFIGGYTFFNQRSDRSASASDVDQNRVTLGLQFGYPINFD